ERTIASNTVSTIASACFLVTSVATATRSISSALVIARLSSPTEKEDLLCGGLVRLLSGPLLLGRRLLGGGRRLGWDQAPLPRNGCRCRCLVHVEAGESDLHLGILDPQDAGAHRVALLVVLLGLLAARERGLRDVHQALDHALDLHEDAEVRDTGDGTLHDVAGLVLLLARLPVVH